ncbi:FAD/NAD(P)-binding domain-containing protein [Coniochaeta ligniaria NRRL 30616]|uniref:FAD/NAD(P)-binding domain-containing protein n=1 Tax=Coniochaeta ligniaria NRRL 30616 TaxID=1408157 RepID=A0A1J7IKK4_9PEZI|nr:FAD/NAD(P)-binding domain-containing protein [Coniochaeta ligniaria NRRL 30616]
MFNTDMLRLIWAALPFMSRFAVDRTVQKVRAVRHSYTYKAVPEPRNVVVIGGSFAGIMLVRRLSETLPTGYRVVLIERNSHIHYVFNFPRFSVISGHEAKAFIPYNNIVGGAPKGIFEQIRGTVKSVTDKDVLLESGERVPYEYLSIATGCSQPFPARLKPTEKAAGCAELRSFQKRVDAAGSIALVGGGAVGVEMAADIKSFFPEKKVTLVHSRAQLLPRFGKRLHDHASKALTDLGVELKLQERPTISKHDENDVDASGQSTLRFKDGHEEHFDLVIPCTGQRANTDLIDGFLPDTISKTTGEIKVDQTLQVTGDKIYPNILALGDVAETGGPKMGRAGAFQAEIVCQNIVAMIHNQKPWATYRPNEAEGAIKLTLGKGEHCMYMKMFNGTEILLPQSGGSDELEVRRFWGEFGVDMDKDSEL